MQGGNRLGQCPVQITPGVAILPIGVYIYFMTQGVRSVWPLVEMGIFGAIRILQGLDSVPLVSLIPCSTLPAKVPVWVFKF